MPKRLATAAISILSGFNMNFKDILWDQDIAKEKWIGLFQMSLIL